MKRSAYVSLFGLIALGIGCTKRDAPSSAVPEASPPQVETTEESRPNFLIVMVDDMGYTDVGAFGGEIDTPNVDSLAVAGVRLSDFHTSASCSPSRSMLLSGADNHRAGLGTMAELLSDAQRGQPGYEGYLNERVASMAEVLRAGGYRSYMAGKWHLGHEDGQLPSDRGFDRSLVLVDGGASHFADMAGAIPADHPATYARDGERLSELPGDFYSSRSYADFLIDAIRAGRAESERPFLAYLAFTAPHDPLHVPEPWLSRYRGRYDGGYEELKAARAAGAAAAGLVPTGAPVRPMLDATPRWSALNADERAYQSRLMEVYAGMVSNLDYHLGRVLAYLRDVGEYENTIILFLSDNGPNAGRLEEYPGNADGVFLSQFDQSVENVGNPGSAHAYGSGWAQASAGPFAHFKMTIGEGGIRAPFIAVGPGIAPGRTSGAFATIMDVVPTLLEAAGVQHPDNIDGRPVLPMDGRSMLGLLVGREERVHPDAAYVAGEMGGGMYVRQGRYKAALLARPHGNGTWALYDLSTDPGETTDLATREPERLEAMKQAFADYAERVGLVSASGQ